MADTIKCPNCQYEIEFHAAAAAQMREHLRKEIEADVRRKEHDLTRRQQDLDREVETKLAAQKASLVQQAQSTMAQQVTDLRAELAGTKTKLAETQASEVALRKDRRTLEEQKAELELTVNRRLDEERQTIREDATKLAVEKHRLRDADRDNLIGDLRRQIHDLQRSAELGSQQAQGETLEIELETILRQQFPRDTIEAVPRSVHGGDVIQHVHDSNGQRCGSILWESKRTKSWNDQWLPKLRDDQRACKADLAAILTLEMPKGLAHFGNVDGAWVTSRGCLIGLAAALRTGLIETGRVRASLAVQHTKADLVAQYLGGAEFRRKVEAIVEACVALKSGLDSEKRSLNRIWIQREKQIERALANTAGLYGEIGGVLGRTLPPIALLELDPVLPDAA